MDPWRLGHRPGLDGLRGVAILMVVVSHLGVDDLGTVGIGGVTVFFTLSGFLITSLLLSEASATGRVSMRRFYWHRLLRLGPAFALLLVVIWPLEYVINGSVPYWWAPVLEVGNWVSATYGAGPLDLLHHTWSLAIEEQFYLVWPVVVLACLRVGRTAVLVTALVGTVASVAVAQVLDPGPRVTFGTDTNAASLLIGCALASVMVERRVPSAPWPALPLGVALVAWGAGGGWNPGLPLVPLGAAVAIWVICTRGAPGFAWAPLRFAGRISYGWYLWNYPVALLIYRADGVMALAPVLSLAIAWVSWRWLEQPVLRARDRPAPDDVASPPGRR